MCTLHRLKSTKQPHKENTSYDDTIYPISINEKEQDEHGRIKIHYIGYGSEYDEWREPAGLIHLDSPCSVLEKYDLYQELALRIKSALIPSRKSNPSVKIVMPFDKHDFCEGLAPLCVQINKTSYRV